MLIKDKKKHSCMFVSCPGNPLHPVRHGVVGEDGTISLVTDRLENTDDIIDSFRESSDIHNIIARISAGEIGLINSKHGFYGDFTDFPKTYAEMLDLIHRGEEFFNKLPAETKEKYNNDFNQFFANFDAAMSELTKPMKDEAKDIVLEKEVSV